MSKQTPILVKTFGADTSVTAPFVCVVMSAANPGNVTLPAAGATKFAGVVLEAPGPAGGAAAVMVAGVAQVQTDGSAPIAPGDYLVIADTFGRVKTGAPAAGANVRQVVGMALTPVAATAGLLTDMLIMPMLYIGA